MKQKMRVPDFAARLSSSRADVLSACKEIKKIITIYNKESKSSLVKFCATIIHNLCTSLQKNQDNVDLFCDILEQTILPNVMPTKDVGKYWDSILSYLRYFHYTLCNIRTKVHLNRCYAAIKLFYKNYYEIQNQNDYKYFLNIHVQHLNFQQQQYQEEQQQPQQSQVITSIELTVESVESLDGLSDLFEDMYKQIKQKNWKYLDVLAEINKMLLGYRSHAFLRFLRSLPEQPCQKLWMSFMKMLSANTMSTAELEACNGEFLGAYLTFLSLDINEQRLQTEYAFQFLRCGRELYKNDNTMNFFYQLLYYLNKLLYYGVESSEYQSTFISLCKKMKKFFDGSAGNISKKAFFSDAIVVVQRFLGHIQSHNTLVAFDTYWQHLRGSTEMLKSYFELILCCMQNAANIEESSLMPSCSTSGQNCVSKSDHIVYAIGTHALNAFSYFVKQQKDDGKCHTAALTALHKTFAAIFDLTVNAIYNSTCFNAVPTVITYLMQRLGLISAAMILTEQAKFFIRLAEKISKIRKYISADDWVVFMRRVYKTSINSQEWNIIAQSHCAYVVSLAKYRAELLRNQICVFYQNTKSCDSCIIEQLTSTSSPLLEPLTKEEKKLIYMEDIRCLLYYFRTNTVLLKSLLNQTQSLYDYMSVARYLPTDETVKKKLKRMHIDLLEKKHTKLTWVDHLILAHLSTIELRTVCESLRVEIDIKDVQEHDLDDYLLKKEIIKIDNESKRFDIARTALKHFKAFHKQYDSIDIQIDWEWLMEDILSVANTTQLMGYKRIATDVWLLLLNIAREKDKSFLYLRAVTYVLSNAEILIHEIDVAPELTLAQKIINDLIPKFSDPTVTILQRHKTFTFICMCEMASYYARKGYVQYANLLLALVTNLHNQLADRRDKIDVVSLTIDVIKFRMLQQCDNLKEFKGRSIPNLLRVMDSILDKLKSFVTFSSVDNIIFMLFAVEFVKQCVECSANRLGERISFVVTTLNMALQAGLALRSIEMLTMWLWSNLQMELIDKAQSKLQIINHLCCFRSIRRTQTEKYAAEMKSVLEGHHLKDGIGLQCTSATGMVQPIRKQSALESEINKRVLVADAFKGPLERYINGSNENQYMMNQMYLKWLYLIAGCLNARLNFLLKDYTQLESFYENVKTWFQEQSKNPEHWHSKVFKNIQLLNAEYCVNFFRATNNHEKALQHLTDTLKFVEQCPIKVDINYKHNLILQLHTARREKDEYNLHIITEKTQKLSLRRALTFRSSEEDDQIDLNACRIIDLTDLNACRIIDLTDLNESIAAAVGPKQATTKQRTPKTTRSKIKANNIDLCETPKLSGKAASVKSARKASSAIVMGTNSNRKIITRGSAKNLANDENNENVDPTSNVNTRRRQRI